MLSAQLLHFPHHLIVFGVARARLGHEHEIDPAREQQLVAPECFPHPTFYSVTHDRATELARSCDAQSRWTGFTLRQHEHEKAIGVELASRLLNPQILAAPAKPLAFREAFERQSLLLGDGDRQLAATLAATTLEGQAAAFGAHPLAEAVGALAALVMGLVSALHGPSPSKRMAAEL
jgi:hypothetical protein